MNLFTVPVKDGGVRIGDQLIPVPRDALAAAGREVIFGIRPEHVEIADSRWPRTRDRRRRGTRLRSIRVRPQHQSTDGRRIWSPGSTGETRPRRARSCTSASTTHTPTSSVPTRPASAWRLERACKGQQKDCVDSPARPRHPRRPGAARRRNVQADSVFERSARFRGAHDRMANPAEIFAAASATSAPSRASPLRGTCARA